MNGNFKQCPNGHYYSASLSQCPYCPKSDGTMSPNSGATGDATIVSNNNLRDSISGDDSQRTIDTSLMPNSAQSFSNPNAETIAPDMHGHEPVLPVSSNKTVVLEEQLDAESGEVIAEFVRSKHKLVGWLVSYTLDEMGVDFKLYEGRNLIGRDLSNQITIQDPTVSAEHALLLFRAGKFSITDRQSTQGTFVNDEDIELEPRYLKDGDMIRIGKTLLRFRSAL